MNPQFIPIARKNGIIVQRLEDETLVYDLENNRAMCLNKTAAEVWRNCDGKNTVLDIRDILSIKLKTNVTIGVVELALDQLSKEKLIDSNLQIDLISSRESRRGVIKKLGLASSVALPMIAAIVAPRVINAQSSMVPLLANGQPCTSSTQCLNMCCDDPGSRGMGLCSPIPGSVACLA